MRHSDVPGLHITYASDEFLLATKLIAQRRKDAGDIITLTKRLHLENASSDDLEQLIYRYYTDEESLEFILDGNDTNREVHLLATRAEQMLANHQSRSTPTTPGADTEAAAVRRRDRGTSHERS
ncbi:hypothetical protein ACWGID_17140 [Kribbella sp. NPDC054772]